MQCGYTACCISSFVDESLLLQPYPTLTLNQDLRRKQVSMEAHDGEGRLEEVLRVLREGAKFDTCVVDQSDVLEGSTLYNVFCTRRSD